MTLTQVLEILNEGGKIGGHTLGVYDKNHNKLGKVSRKVVDKLVSSQLVKVEYQHYLALWTAHTAHQPTLSSVAKLEAISVTSAVLVAEALAKVPVLLVAHF